MMSGGNSLRFAYPVNVIFEGANLGPDYRCNREPLLRRMPDDSLVCVHYTGGPTEPHEDNVVAITRSEDDGATWSRGEVIFEHPVRAAWSTELFVEAGTPRLFVHTFDPACHYCELRASMSLTADSGRSWSEPVSIPGGCANLSVRRGVVLADGSWVFPVYWQEQRGRWAWPAQAEGYLGGIGEWRFCSGAIRSTDGGKSFSLHGYLHGDLNLWEPNIVEISPGRLVMLMRAEGTPRLYRSDSSDGGLTWSPAQPTDIPNANAKVTLLKLNKAVLMLHNPSEQSGWFNRRRIELWISRDGCNTWPVKMPLAEALAEGHVITYPDGFVDLKRQALYLALDDAKYHYFMKVPLADLAL